jgi:hypothetical protein
MGWGWVFPKIVIGGGWRTISMYLYIYNNIRSRPASAMDMHIDALACGQIWLFSSSLTAQGGTRMTPGELENVDHPACLRRLEGEILGIGGHRFRKEGMSRAVGHSGEEDLM